MSKERRNVDLLTKISFGLPISSIRGFHIYNRCEYCMKIEDYLSSGDRFTNPNSDLEKYDKSKCTCDLSGLNEEEIRLKILNLTNIVVRVIVVGNYNNDEDILRTVEPQHKGDPDYFLEFSELVDRAFEYFPNLYIIYDKDSLDLSTINNFKYKDRLVEVGESYIKFKYNSYRVATIIKTKPHLKKI